MSVSVGSCYLWLFREIVTHRDTQTHTDIHRHRHTDTLVEHDHLFNQFQKCTCKLVYIHIYLHMYVCKYIHIYIHIYFSTYVD